MSEPKSQNCANHVKWLMTDLLVDLTSATSMAREVIREYETYGNKTKAMGRLRVCNHSIIISLSKLFEVREIYSHFLNSLPEPVTAPLYRHSKEIQKRRIRDFRNKYAAHIIDKNTKQPISLKQAEELLEQIFGKDNSLANDIYEWIYPEQWKPGISCVLTAVQSIRDHCKGLPGGDLERP